MAEQTKIEWANATFNPWIGCTKVAPGCANCYAEADMDTRRGRVRWGPHGTRSKTSEDYWKQPLRWNRKAEREGRRLRVFCASLADVFEDWHGSIVDHNGDKLFRGSNGKTGRLDEFAGVGVLEITMSNLRRDLFNLIDQTPWLDWMLLTKRPENIRYLWPQTGVEIPHKSPPVRNVHPYRSNVWLYTSIATQADAERNIPLLLECRDLVPRLGVSAEPLLEEINFSLKTEICDGSETGGPPGCGEPVLRNVLNGWETCGCCDEGCEPVGPTLDHVIVGGESGPNARPCTIGHVRSIVQQCQAAGVPVFVKQLGAVPVNREGERCPHIRHPKGADESEWPEDLRGLKQFPQGVQV